MAFFSMMHDPPITRKELEGERMMNHLRTQETATCPPQEKPKNGQKSDRMIIRKLDAHEVCMPKTYALPRIRQRRE